MKIKKQAIKELNDLRPDALVRVYDFITELKRKNQTEKRKTATSDYMKVREALSQCKCSLSEDIILEREDRI